MRQQVAPVVPGLGIVGSDIGGLAEAVVGPVPKGVAGRAVALVPRGYAHLRQQHAPVVPEHLVLRIDPGGVAVHLLGDLPQARALGTGGRFVRRAQGRRARVKERVPGFRLVTQNVSPKLQGLPPVLPGIGHLGVGAAHGPGFVGRNDFFRGLYCFRRGHAFRRGRRGHLSFAALDVLQAVFGLLGALAYLGQMFFALLRDSFFRAHGHGGYDHAEGRYEYAEDRQHGRAPLQRADVGAPLAQQHFGPFRRLVRVFPHAAAELFFQGGPVSLPGFGGGFFHPLPQRRPLPFPGGVHLAADQRVAFRLLPGTLQRLDALGPRFPRGGRGRGRGSPACSGLQKQQPQKQRARCGTIRHSDLVPLCFSAAAARRGVRLFQHAVIFAADAHELPENGQQGRLGEQLFHGRFGGHAAVARRFFTYALNNIQRRIPLFSGRGNGFPAFFPQRRPAAGLRGGSAGFFRPCGGPLGRAVRRTASPALPPAPATLRRAVRRALKTSQRRCPGSGRGKAPASRRFPSCSASFLHIFDATRRS